MYDDAPWGQGSTTDNRGTTARRCVLPCPPSWGCCLAAAGLPNRTPTRRRGLTAPTPRRGAACRPHHARLTDRSGPRGALHRFPRRGRRLRGKGASGATHCRLFRGGRPFGRAFRSGPYRPASGLPCCHRALLLRRGVVSSADASSPSSAFWRMWFLTLVVRNREDRLERGEDLNLVASSPGLVPSPVPPRSCRAWKSDRATISASRSRCASATTLSCRWSLASSRSHRSLARLASAVPRRCGCPSGRSADVSARWPCGSSSLLWVVCEVPCGLSYAAAPGRTPPGICARRLCPMMSRPVACSRFRNSNVAAGL